MIDGRVRCMERKKIVKPVSEQEFYEAISKFETQFLNTAYKEHLFSLLGEQSKRNIVKGKTLCSKAYRNFIKNQRKEQRKLAKVGNPISTMDSVQLITSDIKDVIHEIPENSIDCIITDPPYPREYLHLYGELGILGKRVLKNGGLLVAMVGQSYVPEILHLLSKNLEYHWMCAYLTPGGQSVQLWQRRINTFWKPLLIFRKGKYDGDWFGDVCKSNTNDNDKRFHEWGQSVSGMLDIVNRFTYPNWIILDPFCGAGTTGVACALTGRRFIGIDISSECIYKTKMRITEVIKNER